MSKDSKPPTVVSLDYSIIRVFGGWEIWTPDSNGACIGFGRTKQKAKENTVKHLELTCEILMGIKAKPV